MRGLTIPPVLALALVALTACLPSQAEDSLADDIAEGPFLSAEERAACLAAGGRVDTGGLFPGELCFRPTGDAGQSCSRESDCEGFCLAETRTCAPVTPMFGCTPILDEDGQEVTICMD